jgi:hypothetical protein
MRRSVLVAFGIAALAFALDVLIFLAIEPHVSVAHAFAPGLLVQNSLSRIGLHSTNRVGVGSTFFIFWLGAFAILEVLRRRRRAV